MKKKVIVAVLVITVILSSSVLSACSCSLTKSNVYKCQSNGCEIELLDGGDTFVLKTSDGERFMWDISGQTNFYPFINDQMYWVTISDDVIRIQIEAKRDVANVAGTYRR